MVVYPLLFLTCVILQADSVELKTGERIDGTFKSADSRVIVIDVAGQPVTIETEKVRSIKFGAPESPAAGTASPLLAAIEALRGLKSVTESGVSYAQYAPRVLDAKVVVDRITKDGSPAAVAAVASMLYYQLASSVWNMAVAPTTATSLAQSQTVGNALLTTDCPGLAALVGNIMKGLPAKTPANMKVPLLAEMMKNREPVIWACASSKLADAEAAAK